MFILLRVFVGQLNEGYGRPSEPRRTRRLRRCRQLGAYLRRNWRNDIDLTSLFIPKSEENDHLTRHHSLTDIAGVTATLGSCPGCGCGSACAASRRLGLNRCEMLTIRIMIFHDPVALTCGGGVFQFKSKEGSISAGWSICASILSNSEFRSCKPSIVLSR